MAKKLVPIKGSVRLRGQKWHYSFDGAKINGKRNTITGVCEGATTEKEAIQYLNKVYTEYIEYGTLSRQDKISFSDFVNSWEKRYFEYNDNLNTQSTYKSLLKNHIIPILGKHYLTNITPIIVQDLINTKSKTMAKSSISSIIAVLDSIFYYAVHVDRLVISNPCDYVRIPKKLVKTDQQKTIKSNALTIEQINEIFSYWSSDLNMFGIYLMGYIFGIRISEACAICWEDFDFDKNILHIKRQIMRDDKSKTYKVTSPKSITSDRDLVFNEAISKFLKKLKSKQSQNKIKYGEHFVYYVNVNDYIVIKNNNNLKNAPLNFVFTLESGKFLTKNHVTGYTVTARRNLGFYFRYHQFRHTHGTMIRGLGADPFEVQGRLGHAKVDTTSIYVEEDEASANKMKDILDVCLQKINLSTIG